MKYRTNSTHRGSSPVRRQERYAPAVAFVGIISVLLVAACVPVAGPDSGEGSLSIDLGDAVAATLVGSDYPEATSYVFSGSGPGGESFSTVKADDTATVKSLTAGEWTIVVEGLDDTGAVVLVGETVIDVIALSSVKIELALEPVEGVGEVFVEVSWNADHTIDPSVRMTLADNGDDVLEAIVDQPEHGLVEHSWGDLPTGYYRLSVELFDGDDQVSGSAGTARVVHGRVAELVVQLDPLNKVGLPVDITNDEFDIGWDPPDASAPNSYRIYYRERGVYGWSLLDTVEAESAPRFTITQGILEYGTYEFAVSSVTDGEESDLHTSMSDDADPVSGWYVRWSGS